MFRFNKASSGLKFYQLVSFILKAKSYSLTLHSCTCEVSYSLLTGTVLEWSSFAFEACSLILKPSTAASQNCQTTVPSQEYLQDTLTQ